MKNFPVLFFLALAVFLSGCSGKGKGSKAPQLDLLEVFPDSLRAGNPYDTVYIHFYMLDEDGDIGWDQDQDQNYDIYIKDSRIDTFAGYFFPLIDKEIKDLKKGLEGEGYFFLRGDFMTLRDDSIHQATGDTTQLQMYIQDRKGNKSNTVDIGTIYIRPL
ncbi:MAG: hypothetical protein JNL72_09130 [Flavipsychrobacter sp.]|nr:hypothetical protein [Flavipsychrobacter sp.]